ncbi:MAG: phytanoyl-CoA dioxygenase family protein [Pseudonocardiales bacterium]|nr:phytanoyl-CoA dioxygenase family protein [Pseudonocardiales bacterium]
MHLSQDQVRRYREKGCLLLDQLFDAHEVQGLLDTFRRDSKILGEHRIAERDRDEVRAVYGSHQRQPEFSMLVRSPRLLGPVQQLLGDDVYVYQFKINAKPAFAGEGWSWHQDYAAWKIADNLPAPRLINAAFFLDDINEFNGPIIFVPGSHRQGLVRETRRPGNAESAQHLDPEDIALTPTQMTALVDQYGMESPKGKAGSVVLFHPEIVHGSASNMSPFHRRLLIATYNDVRNEPRPLSLPRPEYLVGRDTEALEMVEVPLVRSPGGV